MVKVSKEKKKKPIQDRPEQKDNWEFSHSIAFWGLAILLFLPPYFRGLFFQPEQERALIFAAVVFWFAWLWKWSKRDNNFLSHPLDYFVLAFPLVYIISAFQAANYGLAVDEVVKTTLYFIVFWLASRLVRNEKDVVTLLQVIYISAIGVALAGLATATGIIDIKDGFLNGRIYSSFQYPNALASYLAAAIFIGLYLWRRADSPEFNGAINGTTSKGVPAWLGVSNLSRYLFATGNFLLLAVFLGTKSQGGFLVFSIIFTLFIIGLPKGNRIPVVIHFILLIIPAVLAAFQFLSSVAGGNMDLAWLWIFLGLAIMIAGQYLYNYINTKGFLTWISSHKNFILAIILLVVISGCIGAGIYISGNSDTVNSLVNEIKMRNATERFYFFNDALKMFKERPIIGWGGGGWQEAYRAYQGYLYNSNQVHGHYFQVMVEGGILGLLAILGIWFSFLYIAHKLYHGSKQDTPKRFLVWTIMIAAVAIGFHAAIDFDLSLSALAIVLWTLFGLARGIGIYSGANPEEKKSKTYIPPNYTFLGLVTAAAIVIVMFASSLAIAGSYAKQAGKYLQARNLNQGAASLQKAIAFNPFNADYHSTLLRAYKAQGNSEAASTEAMKALDLSKYSSQRYADLADINFSGKENNEEAVTYAEKALSLAPFQIQWYEFLARTYFVVGYNELTSGNKKFAEQYLNESLKVPKKIKNQMSGLTDLEKRLWKDGPLLASTPAIKLNIGASQYILGMWPEAEENLKAASQDEKSKGEALLWLSLVKNKQGKEQEAIELLHQAETVVPQMVQGYEDLKKLPILK